MALTIYSLLYFLFFAQELLFIECHPQINTATKTELRTFLLRVMDLIEHIDILLI